MNRRQSRLPVGRDASNYGPKDRMRSLGPTRQGASKAGEMAEWLKAPHSKCGVLARVPGVRIPLSPPTDIDFVGFSDINDFFSHNFSHIKLFGPPLRRKVSLTISGHPATDSL
jgi:hypothetical protein